MMKADIIGLQFRALLIWSLLSASALPSGWQHHEVQQLNGKEARISLPAKYQVVTETWNRIARNPILVYMPEKKRLLMLISCDDPISPLVMHSDDLGATWTTPDYVRIDGKGQHDTGVGVSLTYLGQGRAVLAVEKGRYFSEDYGRTWRDPVPTPPSSDGGPWYQWDPYMVDRDQQTGKIVRIWETGYNVDLGYSQAYIRFRSDEGRTWGESLRVPQWKGANEVALLRAQNGDIVAACRTEKSEKFAHEWIDHFGGMGISISEDDGRTWSKLNMLYEWGRHHPSMLLLPGGDIVMTHVVRKGYLDAPDGFPQFGIEAIVSRDHGKTWDLDHKYLLAVWKGNRKDKHAWWAGCQSTSSVLLPDGSILTAFGTGYRSRPAKDGHPGKPLPRDVSLVQWQVNNKGLNTETTLRSAAFDSDLRNVFDPNPN